MDRHSVFRWGFIILTIIITYLSYLVLKPFLLTIIMTFILTFIFHPFYRVLLRKTGMEKISSLIVVILVFLVLVIPATFLVTKLVTEATQTYRNFVDADIQLSDLPIIGSTALISQSQGVFDGAISGAKDYIVLSTPNVLGEVASMILHLFVFFFIMFFANIQGQGWYQTMKQMAPLKPDVKRHIFTDLERVVYGMVHGQFLTAVIQGSLGGLMFFVFGVPSPIFWGFIMIVFSFIPFLGTPLIFIPAGLIELAQGDYIAGIGVLTFGLLVVMNIDNFVRPYFVNKFATVHPIIVLVGVLGGLQVFGFAGMIIGPLILALFFTLAKDFTKHKELLTKG